MKILIKKLLNLTENSTLTKPPAAFRLSDDVLISIFMLNLEQRINIDNCMDIEIPQDLQRPILQRTMRRTSQVCRRWRLVALTCPALWSNIELSCTNLRWIQEMMRRAIMRNGFGRVSLSCYSRDALSQITQELLSHAYSYSGIVSTKLWSLLTNELTSPTTKLDSLFVFPPLAQNSFANLTGTPSLGEVGIVVKPCLKRLSFSSYFPIDMTHSNLSSITMLVIRAGDPRNPEYTMSEIPSTLTNMPSLQDLSLFVSFRDGIDQICSISLPFLARLKLEGNHFSISLLLSNIDFPLSCLLRISCHIDNHIILPMNMPNILDPILTAVAKNMAYGFTHNLTISLAKNGISIKESPLISSAIPRNRKDDVWYTEICCTAFVTVPDWITVVEAIIAVFRGIFQTTTHLTLSPLAGFFYPIDLLVFYTLQPFITLDTINLSGDSHLIDLVSLFKVPSKNGGKDLLPVLRNIELYELRGSTLKALINFIVWRIEQNKGLHTLDLHFRPKKVKNQFLPMTKRDLSRLRQFVEINVYYIKDSNDYSRWLIKTKILRPILGNAGGLCRLDRVREL